MTVSCVKLCRTFLLISIRTIERYVRCAAHLCGVPTVRMTHLMSEMTSWLQPELHIFEDSLLLNLSD